MSETSPFVLPTYQAVLNRTIANVVDQLNFGDDWAFYNCLKTLWRICPPVVKEETKESLQNMRNELGNARFVTGVDLYWRRRNRNERQIRVIKEFGPPLFEEIMESLHTHGFLLKTPVFPTRPSTKRLEV